MYSFMHLKISDGIKKNEFFVFSSTSHPNFPQNSYTYLYFFIAVRQTVSCAFCYPKLINLGGSQLICVQQCVIVIKTIIIGTLKIFSPFSNKLKITFFKLQINFSLRGKNLSDNNENITERVLQKKILLSFPCDLRIFFPNGNKKYGKKKHSQRVLARIYSTQEMVFPDSNRCVECHSGTVALLSLFSRDYVMQN